MTESGRTNGGVYVNPVSLGTLYFSFALSLWTSKQIDNLNILGIATLTSLFSLSLFVAVFSEKVLKKLSKWVVKPLIGLTFIAFLYGFITGWVQAFSQASGIILQVIAYFGFAWIITIFLVLVRDAVATTNNNNRLFIFIKNFITYGVIIAFIIIAILKFINGDFWSGGYLIGIVGLSLAIVRGWLKLHGSI